jgi:hypothetical protein
MKNKGLLGFIIALLLGGGGYATYDNLGAASGPGSFNNLTSYATSTTAENPVKVLDLDVNRRYALFQNNSDADIWLFATTTALSIAGTGADNTATTSITVLNGVLLEAKKAGAPVATWELTPENMVYSHIWASSTAASKEIIVNYK